MLFQPVCLICGQTSATVEVVPPHTQPDEWESWDDTRRQTFAKYRDPNSHQLLCSTPGGSNGWVGEAIDSELVDRIIAAFSGKPRAEAFQAAGFYDNAGFCAGCGAFYCEKHWSVSATGFGTCPQGHGKSLDSFWHPDSDD